MLLKNYQMGHPRIGQVIISCIQLTLLSSAVREITNERDKLKYLTHKTEPLSFPKWNVMVSDNQDKQMSESHNLHFRDRLPQIYSASSPSSPHLPHQLNTMFQEHQIPSCRKDRNIADSMKKSHVLAPGHWTLSSQRMGFFPSLRRAAVLWGSSSINTPGLHNAVSLQPGLRTRIQPSLGSLPLSWLFNFPLSSQFQVYCHVHSGHVRGHWEPLFPDCSCLLRVTALLAQL